MELPSSKSVFSKPAEVKVETPIDEAYLDSLGNSTEGRPCTFIISGQLFFTTIGEYGSLEKFANSSHVAEMYGESKSERVIVADTCPETFTKLLMVMREGKKGIPNNDNERRVLRTAAADFKLRDVYNLINEAISERELIHKAYEQFQVIEFYVGPPSCVKYLVSKDKVLDSDSLFKDYLDMKQPPKSQSEHLIIPRPATYAQFVFDFFENNVQTLPSCEKTLNGILEESYAYKLPKLTRLVEAKMESLGMKPNLKKPNRRRGARTTAVTELREKENSTNQSISGRRLCPWLGSGNNKDDGPTPAKNRRT